MGQAKSSCYMVVKTTVDSAQEKVMAVLCCGRKRAGPEKSGAGAKYRYGSLASGGKYDESDEEDARGILYNNNLLMDDDDEEE